MKYFIVSKDLATKNGLTGFRQGGEQGYVCMSGDLCGIDVNAAIGDGSVRIVSPSEADAFLRQIREKSKMANENTAEVPNDEKDVEKGEKSDESAYSQVAPADSSEDEAAKASDTEETPSTEKTPATEEAPDAEGVSQGTDDADAADAKESKNTTETETTKTK